MSKKVWIISVILLILIGGILFKTKVIVISDKKSNIIKYYPRLTPINLSFCYKHSVEKTKVCEFFIVNNSGEIILKETTFRSYGAGLPIQTENFEIREEEGDFIVKNINKKLPELNMRVSRTPGMFITINNKKIELQNYFSPGHKISIKVSNLLQFF